MRKQIIGALVGGLILFFWQFLSNTVLNIHVPQTAHNPQQEAILKTLADLNVEEGHYYMPQPTSGATQEEHQAYINQQIGKPWAMLSYHKAMRFNMGSNLLRGFVIDFLSVFLLVWILVKITNLDFKTAFLSSLAVGFIGYMTIDYLNAVWYETNSIPNLIDAVVQWSLVGAWLGWWLKR